MTLRTIDRSGAVVVGAALAILLASCGAGDDGGVGDDVGAVDPPVDDVSATDASATEAAASPSGDAPTREVVGDGPEAFVDQLGCSMAPDEAVAALLEAVTAEVEVAPAVAAPIADELLGGLAIGAMIGDEDRTVAVWHWDPDAGLLRPLTPEAVALEGGGADTSLVPEPGADGAISWSGEFGVPLAQDCATFVGQSLLPTPPRPAPEVREDLVVVSPTTVAPGDLVEVRFPQETERGVAYALQREASPGTWVDVWWMTSDGNGGDPVTVPAGTEGYGVEDVGVGGPGPDRVLVDPGTEPGAYRLCTANARDDVCGLVSVEE